ncbi:MAG: hypothetical protein PWP27_1952 [Clostridiales bacterium]|nr:hypothetical protein [Clostridiales bacterium]MDK2934142.1 hypothetical protein [Clostridiales bacterium]
MNKKNVIISVIVTILIVSSMAIGAAVNISTKKFDKDSAVKFGKTMKNYNEKKDSKVVAKVNDIKIYEKDIQKRRDINKISKKTQTDKEIILDIARTQLLLNEAKNRGIDVSEDEARTYAKKEKEMIYKNPETKETLIAYINALGLTEDEYWNNYTIKEIQKMLTISALNRQIADEILAGSDIPINEKAKKQREIIDNFKSEIVKNAKIEILEEQYK